VSAIFLLKNAGGTVKANMVWTILFDAKVL